MLTLEEKFYVGEYGFDFIVETGLSMIDLVEGEIRSVLRRPHGGAVRRNIAVTDILDAARGTVLMRIGPGDLSAPGEYQGQVYIRDADTGHARPSHTFAFDACQGLSADPDSLFA